MLPRIVPTLRLVLVMAAAAIGTGCTSIQLRHSTVAQSTTLGDIYTKQVMNNIALFIANPDALPFFAYPNQGTTAIQDFGALGGPGYTSANFVTTPLALNLSRQATENWVLVPISDPAKLALMRCAYRQALSSCIPMVPAGMSLCPNCTELRREFYGPGNSETGDRVNADLPCLDSACWLSWGCKHMVPKDCDAHYVGAYHHLYVWVPPAGRDMLTRLTLTILDYAVNDPRQFERRTKTVEMYVNEDGSINYEGNGKGVKLTASIPIDVPSTAIAVLDRAPAYGEFLERYSKAVAERILAAAEASKEYDRLDQTGKREFWANIDLDIDPTGKPWSADLRPAVKFIRDNNILPWLVPGDAVLNGPARYSRRGAASEGLQQLGQRLNAALAPTTVNGR
jgi:hypothetical protein